MKKIISIIMSAVLLAVALALPVSAANAGSDGDGYSWSLNSGTLTVTFQREIDGFERTPWLDYNGEIRRAEVRGNITVLPAGIFAYLDKLGTVTLCDSITGIGDRAFAYCKSMTSFTVGADITVFGSCVFKGCSSLGSFSVADGNTAFIAADGVLYTPDKKSLVAYPAAKAGKTYTLPEECENIAGGAFFCAKNLENVNFSSSLVSIGESAFEECRNIKEVTLPDSLTHIGRKAFYDSGISAGYGIKPLTVGNWYLSENGSTFAGNAKVPEGTVHIADGAFEGAPSKTVSLPASLLTVGENIFANCKNLQKINIAEGNTAFSVVSNILVNTVENSAVYMIKPDGDEFTVPEDIAMIKTGAFPHYIRKLTVPNDSCVFEKGSINCTHLYGNEGSSAQRFAEENGISFRIIGRYYNDFTDVDEGAWYASAIEFAVTNSLMSGTSKFTFEPDTPAGRAMLVRVLYNYEGRPDVGGLSHPFTDVKSGEWYEDAVKWAYSKKIISGTSATEFSPEDAMTREQLAVILFNYAKFKGLPTDARADLGAFTDSGDISDYAKTALSWANGNRFITGTTPTTLAPKEHATRAQMASILKRFIESQQTSEQ